MQYPILYSFRRCPYAIRARMAIHRANISCALREVVLRDKPIEMTTLSDKGTVPVLQLLDGRVLDESLDVMLWALKQNDPAEWLNADKEISKKLIDENDFEFKQDLDHYKYHVRFPEQPRSYYRKCCERFLTKLESCLKDHGGNGLIDNKIRFVDIAIFPFIRQLSHVDRKWFDNTQYMHLHNWLEFFEGSDVFLSVMEKRKRWKNGDDISIF